MGLAPNNRPMNQRKSPLKSTRKQTGILVLRRQKCAEAGKCLEILGNRQRNYRAALRKRGICNGKLILLLEPNDTWVFQAPLLLSRVRVGLESGGLVNLPVCESIGASRNGQMREAAHILDANQQQCLRI